MNVEKIAEIRLSPFSMWRLFVVLTLHIHSYPCVVTCPYLWVVFPIGQAADAEARALNIAEACEKPNLHALLIQAAQNRYKPQVEDQVK